MLIFLGSNGCPSRNSRIFKVALTNWQSNYILQLCNMKTGAVTPSSFYFIFLMYKV